jgi:mono/diheme cytochrome c family protein
VVTPGPATGLTASERQIFYHLAEGSELFPLPWMRALVSERTGKPFMDNLERFGLLADPNNPDGLPVGLTATPSRDTRFLEFKMVGVNCAACHVNDLKVGDRTLRIDGGPALFNLGDFYADLLGSAKTTATSPSKLFAFLRTLAQQPEKNTLTASVQPSARARIGRNVASLDALRQGGDLGKGVTAALEALVKEESARKPVDLSAGLRTPRPGVQASHAGFLDGGKKDMSEHWKGKKLAKGSPLARVGTEEALQTRILPQWLDEVRVVIRLLLARADFLLKLKDIQAGAGAEGKIPPAGPGRIDAFGGARNLIFSRQFARPVAAPVSYPHLWGFPDVVWLHWDANTTSVMERNIGQSLGLGAIFNPDSFESTVLPRNLHALEVLAAKIAPPKWPEDSFGKIDQDRATAGAAVFEKKCASCHANRGSPDPDEKELLALDKIGTDEGRALSFAAKLGDRSFSDALKEALGKIKEQAYKDAKVSAAEAKEFDGKRGSGWRTTGRYARRSLVGIWATPPYLHNGSVPTLADLLSPPKDRLATFPLGHRDYDVEKLGYTTRVRGQPKFTFDTRLPGNGNKGHDYGTDLSPGDKAALLEYLKTR